MPLTIKTGYLNAKDEDGVYIRNNTVAEQTTAEQVAEIEAAGAATIASIPSDYTALSNEVVDLQSAINSLEDYALYSNRFNGIASTVLYDNNSLLITVNNSSTWYGAILYQPASLVIDNNEYVVIAEGMSPNSVNYVFYLTIPVGSTNFGKAYVFSKDLRTDVLATDHLDGTVILNTSRINNAKIVIEEISGTTIKIAYGTYKTSFDVSTINVSSSPALQGTFSKAGIGVIRHKNYQTSPYTLSIKPINEYNEYLYPFTNKKAVIIGDSITGQGKYLQSFYDNLYLASVDAYGIGGTPIAKQYEGTTVAFCVRYATYDYTGVNLVFIEGGTNDYGRSIPLGTMGSTDQLTFYGGLTALLRGLKAMSNDFTIVCVTPTQRDYSGSDPTEISGMGANSAGFTLLDYRNAMLEVCARESVPCLDLYAISGLSDDTVSKYTVDGLHWNDLFANRMGTVIARFINELR